MFLNKLVSQSEKLYFLQRKYLHFLLQLYRHSTAQSVDETHTNPDLMKSLWYWIKFITLLSGAHYGYCKWRKFLAKGIHVLTNISLWFFSLSLKSRLRRPHLQSRYWCLHWEDNPPDCLSEISTSVWRKQSITLTTYMTNNPLLCKLSEWNGTARGNKAINTHHNLNTNVLQSVKGYIF